VNRLAAVLDGPAGGPSEAGIGTGRGEGGTSAGNVGTGFITVGGLPAGHLRNVYRADPRGHSME
jgi:hypothetical protein